VVLGSSTLAQFNGVVMIAIMVEGLLWAATGPAALLTLVRERSEHRLFSASETDFLTGLDNRRAFSRRGQSLLDDTAERGACCNLLVFDLDHFKSINDRNGHQTGDEVLKIFARILQSEAQPQDIVARLGGEEFALLLAGDQTRRPETVAAAVSTRLREATLAFPGFAEPVTVSAGLVSSGDCDVGLDRLVALADAALYRAKFNGRNRLERAEPACGAPVTSGLRPAVA
jgi:diguanylate cyclase (GGDEF)-like protein